MVPLDERLGLLRTLVHALPLFQPYAPFDARGRRAAPVVPRVFRISANNSDRAHEIAHELEADVDYVVAQLEAESAARLSELPIDFLPPEHLIDFERFAYLNDDPRAPDEPWWYLMLPVLHEGGRRAWIAAQLGGRYGADDIHAVFEQGRAGWRRVR
jgi:hypothetical protein